MYTHPDEHAQDIACRDAIRAACPDASADIIYGVIIVSAPDPVARVFTWGRSWIVCDDHSPLTTHATQSSAVARVRAILDAQAQAGTPPPNPTLSA